MLKVLIPLLMLLVGCFYTGAGFTCLMASMVDHIVKALHNKDTGSVNVPLFPAIGIIVGPWLILCAFITMMTQ